MAGWLLGQRSYRWLLLEKTLKERAQARQVAEEVRTEDPGPVGRIKRSLFGTKEQEAQFKTLGFILREIQSLEDVVQRDNII